MRKTIYGCALLLGVTLSGAALAEPMGGKGSMHDGMDAGMGMHGGKMGPGMGHGMMPPHGMGHGMMGGYGGDQDHYARMTNMHMLNALGLNSDQRKKVMELRRELRNNTWDLQRQTIEQREQLGMLYGAETLDIAAIKSAYEKLFQAKLKMIEFSLKYKQELFKVLNAEQRQRMMHGMMGGEEDGSEM